MILHKDGTVSYRSPLRARMVRRVETIPICELMFMSEVDRKRVLDHWRKHSQDCERDWELNELEEQILDHRY